MIYILSLLLHQEFTTDAGYFTTPATTSRGAASETDDTDDEEKKEIFENFGQFPTHIDFISIIKDAQDLADERQERVPYAWRGYKSCVFPGLPKFQIKDYKERLRLALKGVLNITLKERKV